MPGRETAVVFEYERHKSDGTHSTCYTLNLSMRRIRFLGDYSFYGFSHDGSQCLVSAHEWVGPYKQGGQRLGALLTMSRNTHRRRALTGPLVDIGGADWFE